jgi:regulator of protease activity HflC (stomatin/prohibitin superfamily)
MLPLTLPRNLKSSTLPSRPQVSAVGAAVFLICMITGVAVTVRFNNPIPVASGIAIGFYFLFAIRVAEQWQRAAVLRFGRYIGLRGPGMFLIVPVIDQISVYVDQRTRVVQVSAETALTRDTVPVNVDAIVFWMVWNAEKSILEVVNFSEAITMTAQTALLESIGRRSGADDHQSRDAGSRAAAHPGRKDQSLGHHCAIG